MPQKGKQGTCRWQDYCYWPVKYAWHKAADYAIHEQKTQKL